VHFEVKNGSGSCFGMMCDADINFLKNNFLIFLGWHILKMQLCKRRCLGMGIKAIRTHTFFKKPNDWEE